MIFITCFLFGTRAMWFESWLHVLSKKKKKRRIFAYSDKRQPVKNIMKKLNFTCAVKGVIKNICSISIKLSVPQKLSLSTFALHCK